MMRFLSSKIFVAVFVVIGFSQFPSLVFAQGQADSPVATASAIQPTERYFRGTVTEVVEEGEKDIAGYTNFFQNLKVEITSGDEKGKIVQVEYGGVFNVSPQQKLARGDKIVLISSTDLTGNTSYFVMDRYRLPGIVYILAAFFVAVLAVAGRKGFGAILGLGVSLGIIMLYIVPQILDGRDPLLVSISGSLIIMLITIYLAHGISKKTTVALGATFITLVLTGILAVVFVSLAKLTGLGSEDSYLLQFGQEGLNMKGLLLGGIIIGALGVLDDITTAQSAAIFELKQVSHALGFSELVKRGMNIGREHVASLVNTLVLAYAGVSLTLFILFVLNPSNQPYWVILNSEIILEEVARTIAGSMGLILAVPITTLLAAWIATQKAVEPNTQKKLKKK